MRFKQPLSGRYEKVNVTFMRERSQREDDPRKEFYKAILAYDDFASYYREVGHLDVFPPTFKTRPVNADMEIKYAVKMGWVVPATEDTAKGPTL
jgi:hypothetical protein